MNNSALQMERMLYTMLLSLLQKANIMTFRGKCDVFNSVNIFERCSFKLFAIAVGIYKAEATLTIINVLSKFLKLYVGA